MHVPNRGASALVGALVGTVAAASLAGCTTGAGASRQSGPAAVDELAQRLAVAEQRLARDLAPFGGQSQFAPYLAAVASADAGTRQSMAAARSRLGAMSCDGLSDAVAGVRSASGRLDLAISTLNARIAQVRASTATILADRDGVLRARTALAAGLKANPSVRVGQDDGPVTQMLQAIATWQMSMTDAVAAHQPQLTAVKTAAGHMTTACHVAVAAARRPSQVSPSGGPVVEPVAGTTPPAVAGAPRPSTPVAPTPPSAPTPPPSTGGSPPPVTPPTPPVTPPTPPVTPPTPPGGGGGQGGGGQGGGGQGGGGQGGGGQGGGGQGGGGHGGGGHGGGGGQGGGHGGGGHGGGGGGHHQSSPLGGVVTWRPGLG